MNGRGDTRVKLRMERNDTSSSGDGPAGVRQMVMVLHGPEIFDSGNAAWLAEVLSPKRILVAGVMARAAAEESGIPCQFMCVPPSVVIRALGEPGFLANQGKIPDSGRIFGGMVASRVGGEGLIQVECACGEVICWNRNADAIAVDISERTGYQIIERTAPVRSLDQGIRIIQGCLPGEAVFVNGIVIGTATGPEVVIRSDRGKVIAVSGVRIKPHGLEKLERAGPVDVSRAWCKTGNLRSRSPVPARRRACTGRVIFIDHCGHHLYQEIGEGDVCGMVTVGDDTTAVCGHIGAHLGIPVLGIVDGDSDKIVPERYAEGSLLAIAQGVSDDDLGKEVSHLIPEGNISWDECVSRIIGAIRNRAEIRKPPLE
ncbi:MAG: hypothetical protein A4E39_00137 [Methanoregulaceae archaeon PtaB.Bin152]|nr:MAG: hypothetical protein A4E39_00137 [Methanoregulaceae archaeon PtaB.Bin152]